jgi:hypothetical protein
VKTLSIMREADLNEMASNFAGGYVEHKWKSGDNLDRQFVLNIIAHGFSMGVREYEQWLYPKWYQCIFGNPRHLSDVEISKRTYRRARAYLKKHNLLFLSMPRLALARASFSIGFRGGMDYRKNKKL